MTTNRRGPAPKDGPSCGLTRKEFLKAIVQGETISSIEKAWGMKYNTLYSWIKNWNLKGISAGKAREILASEESTVDVKLPSESSSTSEVESQVEPPTAPADNSLVDIIGSLNTEIENLSAANALQEGQLKDLHDELDEWRRTAEMRRQQLSEQEALVSQQEERIRHLLADLEVVNEPVIIVEHAPTKGGITLHIPLLDTGEKDIEDRFKALVEYGGLKGKIGLREIKAPQLMAETLTRLQVIVNIIRAQIEDLVNPADIERTVQQFVSRHNEAHIQRLQETAADRGWEVIGV